MIDLIVELQSAGNLLKNLADNDNMDRMDRDFLLEMLGDRLLLLAGRCEEGFEMSDKRMPIHSQQFPA
jgi:hypothetical protein